MPTKQRIHGPALTRASTGVVVQDDNTIELTFSSEDAVVLRREYWDEPWLERLGHNEGECDLSFLNSGTAPLLWAHDRWSRGNVIGVIQRAWLEDGRGKAIAKLSNRDDVKGLVQDLKDKILSNTSTGYAPLEREPVKLNANGPDEYRVTLWRPFEVSILPVPADESVGVGRSATPDQQRFTVTTIEETNMPNPVQHQPAPPATEQQRQADTAGAHTTPPPTDSAADQIRAAAAAAERERGNAIRALVREHGLDETFERAAIDQGYSLDRTRAAALDALAERQVTHRPRLTTGADEADKTREAAISWLLRKGGEKVEERDLQGNPFVGASMLDIARHRLELRGFRVAGLYGESLARAAISQSTSDFPVLMENVMHKTMRAEFKIVSDTWRSFCYIGTVSDFNLHNSYAAGSIGDLQDVGEDGLLKHGRVPDGEREQVSVKTKGLIITLSRAMIVGDNLGNFLEMAKQLGRSSGRTIEKTVYKVLLANPSLKSDGKPIFHADHGNLITGGAAPTTAGFDAARVAMAKQKDVGGEEVIDIRPAVWLGPVEHGGQARVVNENEFDVDTLNKAPMKNKARGMFKSVVDTPRLSGNQWYAFADPNVEPVLQVSFLNGQQEPQTEMQETFEALGIRWRGYHDFGVDPVGYRGGQKVIW